MRAYYEAVPNERKTGMDVRIGLRADYAINSGLVAIDLGREA
jgi:hypothetical protein